MPPTSTSSKKSLYKIVILGDSAVGKTALTTQFILHHFIDTYDPCGDDNYRRQIAVDGQVCMVEVLDAAGTEEYKSLREQWVRDGSAFVLIYSITSRASFNRLTKFWELVMEVKGKEQVVYFLVGNKCDLAGERMVTRAEGEGLARGMGCGFLEGSAKERRNVDEVFEGVVKALRAHEAEKPDEAKETESNATKRKPRIAKFLERLGICKEITGSR